MNCTDLEALLCDYVDGTLAGGHKEKVETHLAACAACAELVKDASQAAAFLARVESIDVPAELMTRILFHVPSGDSPAPLRRRGLRALLSGWFAPVLQPRLAMGMAMTILSFSLLGRFAGLPDRQLTPADLNPVKVWASVEDGAGRLWDRAVKYYENVRLVYEIQSRLKEWTEQEQEERRAQEGSAARKPAASGEPASGRPDTGTGVKSGEREKNR